MPFSLSPLPYAESPYNTLSALWFREALGESALATPGSGAGYGRIRLRRKGRYWYARFGHAGKRYETALKVANKVAAENLARQINESLKRGESWQWVLSRQSEGVRLFSQAVAEFLEKSSRLEGEDPPGADSACAQELAFGGGGSSYK